MERNTKYKPDHLCIAIFTLCLSVRFVEYFLIETDKTAIGENVRLLCYFILVGINNFSTARQSCTFRNIYQQFFFNRLSNKKYGFRIFSVMCAFQYYQCMDGGRCFSRIIHQNTFRNKAIYAGEFYCRIFIWYLAYGNANQKLYQRRNVICGNASYGYWLYDPCRDYGNQMGPSLPHNRKSMGRAWRPFIQ